jgi:hypothetical protein
MKRFLFLTLFFFAVLFSAFGQEKLCEIDLRVKGVGSGTSYSTVVRKFGKPQRSKTPKFKASKACSNSAETHLTLYYSGLEITLLGDGRGSNLDVYSIQINSKRWIVSGISLGADIKEIERRFGTPDSKAEKNGETIFYYVTKENLGVVNFYFRNSNLVKVLMTETLC